MSVTYKNSPTIEEMQQDRKYRKTLKTYRMAIQRGMMVLPENLEDFPAPVLCAFCEEPVITQVKTERDGKHWFNIVWASAVSVGLLTYYVASTNKDIVHECPSCMGALATWKAMLNGGWHEAKVHAYYNQKPSSAPARNASGHNVDQFQVSGYGKVHVGNQVFITAATNERVAEYLRDER